MMKSLILVCLFHIFFGGGLCQIDFSQFYLPQCCYISQSIPESVSNELATKVNQKRDVSRGAKDNQINLNSTQGEPKETGQGKSQSVYSYVVPLQDGHFASSLSKETKSSFRLEDGDQNHNVSTPTVRKPRNSDKFPKKKSGKSKRIRIPLISIDSTPSPSVLNWDSRRLQSRKLYSPSGENETQQLSENQDENGTQEKTIQPMKKLTSSWVRHLRAALYQSITDGQGFRNGERQGRHYKLEDIIFPDTWESIQSAELQFVDTLSQTTPTNPQTSIYLPPEEGPIISGVFVNSYGGKTHLRAATELHFNNGLEEDTNCRCYLLGPGEILIAYWSVSRIYKENGQPALQFLVYPLPHSAPTPPNFVPFSDSEVFQPSPVDLSRTNHQYTQVSRLEGPRKWNDGRNSQRAFELPSFEVMKKMPTQQQGFQMVQGPTFATYPSEAPTIAFQPSSQIPPNSNALGETGAQQQTSPEYLEQYKLAVQQFQVGPTPIYYASPFDDLSMSDPINFNGLIPILNNNLQQQQPQQYSQEPPSPTSQSFTQPPTNSPQEGFEVLQQQPPPNFPKSIQDIISPQPPLPGEEIMINPTLQPSPFPSPMTSMAPPSPHPHFIPHHPIQNHQQQLQFPPFPVNYPGQFPPAYYAFNLMNHLNHPNQIMSPPNNNRVRVVSKNRGKGIGTATYTTNKGQQQNLVDDGLRQSKPYIITGLMDNEKYFYPVRQSLVSNDRIKYFDNRHDLDRERIYHKQQLISAISKKGGYLLDF